MAESWLAVLLGFVCGLMLRSWSRCRGSKTFLEYPLLLWGTSHRKNRTCENLLWLWLHQSNRNQSNHRTKRFFCFSFFQLIWSVAMDRKGRSMVGDWPGFLGFWFPLWSFGFFEPEEVAMDCLHGCGDIGMLIACCLCMIMYVCSC